MSLGCEFNSTICTLTWMTAPAYQFICWGLGFGLWCLTPLSTIFHYIVAVSFIGGGNQNTQRKPPTCRKSLTNTITCKYIQFCKFYVFLYNVFIFQKQSCMALRNLVARTREYCDPILELGAEHLINNALTNHKICDDEAKAALRDLGCKVELKELWKGEKGEIAY